MAIIAWKAHLPKLREAMGESTEISVDGKTVMRHVVLCDQTYLDLWLEAFNEDGVFDAKLQDQYGNKSPLVWRNNFLYDTERSYQRLVVPLMCAMKGHQGRMQVMSAAGALAVESIHMSASDAQTAFTEFFNLSSMS